MSSADAERNVCELILALDAVGGGLGGKAWLIYCRHLARDVRPLWLRQKSLLERSIRTGEDRDAEVIAIDAEILAAWDRCAEALRILWLTEGPQEMPEDEWTH